MPSTRALIHAPWSASKVSTALRCPRLFHFKYIQKIKEPEVMPEARIGKAIHKALEQVFEGWGSYEGTIKQNEVSVYLDIEDALAAFQKAIKANNSADAKTASTKFATAAQTYLAKHPG